MKIIAHGIDLVDFDRIRKLLDSHGPSALQRVFTAQEQADSNKLRDPIERLAGRFAAKEAVMKLIGTGWRDGVAWTDIEVINDPLGQPLVRITGAVKKIADRKGIEQITLSITHTANFAIASAVALAEK
jgi:holo-[acyl-carrier protein] synthase